MTKYFFLTGTAKWCKLDQPDKKYGFYGLDLYLDASGKEKFLESGLKLDLRKDKETGAEFIKLRRDPEKLRDNDEPKPKKLIFEDGVYQVFTGNIGNGSFVNCKVQVYDSKKGPGHRLDAVAVETLVPYEDGNDEDLPF